MHSISEQQVKIQLATAPDREAVVAELWLGEDMLAELRTESGQVKMQLYARQDGKPWEIEADVFIKALNEAKAQLR